MAIASLDGYVADEAGNFGWAAPDEETISFVNDFLRGGSTHPYGRRMYEVLVHWETAHTVADQPPVVLDFARLWQTADKIVYSRHSHQHPARELGSKGALTERPFFG
jgi:hypothetical protein